MWSVVQHNAGLVTEHELLQLLRQRGLRTPEEAAATAASQAGGGGSEQDGHEGGREASEPAVEALYPQVNPPFPVERALFDRLCRSPAAHQDADRLAKFISLVTDTIELTRAEALQLAAHKPRSGVEVYALVERCSERLTTEEVEQLLQVCDELL